MLRVLLFAAHEDSPSLSYYWDWFEALERFPRFRADVVSTRGQARLFFELWRRRRESYDLILFPYGFYYANAGPRRAALLQRASEIRGKKVFFLENEYRLLNRKLALATLLGAHYVTSQLPGDVAKAAYAPMFPAERIVSLPHGLPERLIDDRRAKAPTSEREIDLGFSGDPYPFYIGHQDRSLLAGFFAERAAQHGLKLELRNGRDARLDRDGWTDFLFRCKGALHHEAGSDFLETNDATRQRVMAYLEARPSASFEEVRQRFFSGRAPGLSGRAVAPRHFEALGTRTCQIMFPGRFNDILRPNEHYLAVARDFSDADEALRRFRDGAYREQLVSAARAYAIESHTLRHRIEQLLAAVGLS